MPASVCLYPDPINASVRVHMPLAVGGKDRKTKEKQEDEPNNSDESEIDPDEDFRNENEATDLSQPLDLEPLSARSLLALRNLARYGRRKARRDGTGHGWSEWPDTRRAAVMVALFGGKSGELNVLLSTRALNLRHNVSLIAYVPTNNLD